MRPHYRVALLGFSEFERAAIGSCLRLTHGSGSWFELTDTMAGATLLVVDLDHADGLRAVEREGRLGDAVCVGARAPVGVAAWTARPIEPLHLLRELEALIALRTAPAPPRAPAVAAAPVPAPSPPIVPNRGPRALLVDDSEIALRHLELQLQHLGLRTERARNAQLAMQWLRRERFDLVFIDVELGPGSSLDGLQLCRQIQAAASPSDGHRPRIVMTSAHQGEVDRVRGALAGCDAYLGKPLRRPDLAGVLALAGAAH